MSASQSLEERVRRLEDRADIRDLTHRYCDLVWRRGGEAIADLYSEDGVFMPDGKPAVRGREALRKFYRELGKRTSNEPHPYVHNHVITITGDTAKATCYLDNRHGDGTAISGGYYDDEFRRTPLGWKFTLRHSHRVFGFTVAVQPK